MAASGGTAPAVVTSRLASSTAGSRYREGEADGGETITWVPRRALK